MKHLQTFESFTELNEATKANPNDIKVGDLIRYEPSRQRGPQTMSAIKVALYGKCKAVQGETFSMVAVGWSDKSKQQPEFAYINNDPGFPPIDPNTVFGNEFVEKYPSKFGIRPYRFFTSMPIGKFDWEKAIDSYPAVGNIESYPVNLLSNCTIWKP